MLEKNMKLNKIGFQPTNRGKNWCKNATKSPNSHAETVQYMCQLFFGWTEPRCRLADYVTSQVFDNLNKSFCTGSKSIFL